MDSRTVTSLKRWSCQAKELPGIADIRAIHVYDFDNTLFMTPLPNPKLWNGPSIGHLQQPKAFTNGGWWHDARILEATGRGITEEEPRAWEGWWNEQIASLVLLSMQQKDALSVLLTGRSEDAFGDIIKRLTASKKLEFDMICLKPEVGPKNQRFANTMAYKQALLEDIIFTYREAQEIRVYEDRTKHVKGFRDFFTSINRSLLSSPTSYRKPITAEVIQVSEGVTNLDPVIETAEIQRMINDHNSSLARGLSSEYSRLAIKRTILYTGYLIPPPATASLLSLVSLPPNMPDTDIRYLGNNILITPRPCPRTLLDKVGGIGHRLSWQVTGTAIFENKIWAASVRPVPDTARYHTENKTPIVILALRKGARPIDASRIQNWQPVSKDKAIVFDAVVGEKVLLRIEEEHPGEGEWESLFPSRHLKRRHLGGGNADTDTDSPSYHTPRYADTPDNNSHRPPYAYAARGDRGRGGGSGGNYRGNRGGGSYRGHGRGGDRDRGGGSGRGRGRGGGGGGGGPPHGYRSLDDMPDRGPNRGLGNGGVPNYDDPVGYGTNGGGGGGGGRYAGY
ncbi:MAG: hypothetical protein M1817_006745 [Caeruleum heppii]|nr:MAG: hypothetical protein M1817_006745 [Caeruleum heppii]